MQQHVPRAFPSTSGTRGDYTAKLRIGLPQSPQFNSLEYDTANCNSFQLGKIRDNKWHYREIRKRGHHSEKLRDLRSAPCFVQPYLVTTWVETFDLLLA